jgi:O-acetyl-ADP-ribose deacetylase (regulator of RNase III)
MIRRKVLKCGTVFEVERGDITRETTDAIVNAANSRLAGGGGVDGAIHRAGGPQIMAECRKFPGCPTGFAVVTTGGKLKAKWVIHAVGPIYSGLPDDARLLASAYRNSLSQAIGKKAESVSFPSISTGVYGYPIEDACPIALSTCADFVQTTPGIKVIRFIVFSDADFAVYVKNLERLEA